MHEEGNTKDISTLKHSEWNPRRISKHDFDALIKSMQEFGDLSGIVKNIETGTLVGGNQRLEALKRMNNPKIVITERMTDGPDPKGTLAHGYVETGEGTRFSYREVMWPLEKEMAANIAANRIQGEFDLDLLAEVNYKLSQAKEGADLLKLTGQSDEEIKRLLSTVAGFEPASEDEQGKLDSQAQMTCPNCAYHGTENEFRKAKTEA